MTPAERDGIMKMAKMMSIKDLKWQIANGKKLGLTAPMIQIFKDVLAVREITK